MAVSLTTIAKEAGVSRMTVSRILRDVPTASPSTKQRVLAIVRKHNYIPDKRVSEVMRAFRKPNTPRYLEPIAVLQHKDFPYLFYDIKRFDSYANTLGFRLDNLQISDATLRSKRVEQILTTRGIRGLLILPGVQNLHEGLHLDWDKYTSVVLGSSFSQSGLPRVRSDHYQLIADTLKHIFELGYKNVGLVIHRNLDERSERRMTGAFLSARHNLSPSKIYRSIYRFDVWDDALTQQWIQKMGFDAVILPSRMHIDSLCRFSANRFADLGVAISSLGESDKQSSGMRENHVMIFENALRLLAAQLNARQTGLHETPPIIHVPAVWQPGKTLHHQVAGK